MSSNSRYNFSLTTFSPSGKLGQIEHALTAVNKGVTAIGIKVILTQKTPVNNPLVNLDKTEKVSIITPSIGITYAGLGPDFRIITQKARKIAIQYKAYYNEEIPILMLVKKIANVMQEFTQSGGVRPFGISLLVSGYDHSGFCLYQVDPSGSFFPWKATVIGKNLASVKNFLEKRMDIEDAIHTALLALKEGVEGELDQRTVDIGIVSENKIQDDNNKHIIFRRLKSSEIKDYLSNLMQ